MLQIFIGLLLLTFLTLFIVLSVPMKSEVKRFSEKPKNQVRHSD